MVYGSFSRLLISFINTKETLYMKVCVELSFLHIYNGIIKTVKINLSLTVSFIQERFDVVLQIHYCQDEYLAIF